MRSDGLAESLNNFILDRIVNRNAELRRIGKARKSSDGNIVGDLSFWSSVLDDITNVIESILTLSVQDFSSNDDLTSVDDSNSSIFTELKRLIITALDSKRKIRGIDDRTEATNPLRFRRTLFSIESSSTVLKLRYFEIFDE